MGSRGVPVSEALVTEFENLLSGLTVYSGRVPAKPAFPYVLVLTSDSISGERSMARTPAGSRLWAQTTVVGLTVASVRIVARQVRARLEGSRMTGNVGRIEEVPNGQPVLEDRDVVDTATGLHPLYVPLEWVAVYS